MTVLTRSWIIMSTLVILVAGILAFSPAVPRAAWIVLILGAGFVKARLILLDYLELRYAGTWKNGAVAALGSLFILLTVLAMP